MPSLVPVLEDWDFETERTATAFGSIRRTAVCAFIQHLLQRFNPQGRVSFEWSHDCSKPRTDAYGGGAAVVAAQDIKTMSTSAWLDQQRG